MSSSTTEVPNAINYDLKPSEIYEAMEVADYIKDSLMIWGSPGIGKSEMALQYANDKYPIFKNNVEKLELLKKRAYDATDVLISESDYLEFKSKLLYQETNFIDFRLSQIEPSDLRGIPIPIKLYYDVNGNQLLESELSKHDNYITETGVVWAAPAIFKLPKDWKGVILFDEINSAMPIVQAASYQLILDRCIGELILPENALILAAGNRETDGGVTFSLATPLRDRMTHVEMVPSYEEWIDNYAIPNLLHPATIAFIKETGNKHFNTLSTKDKSHAGGASPRSWTRVSNIEEAKRKLNTSNSVYKSLIAGRVGNVAAIDYITYIENMADMPEVYDILSGAYLDLGELKNEVSKNYFITICLVQKIIELYKKKINSELSLSDWSNYVVNFLKFIDFNFSEKQAELIILAIRTLTSNDVSITYREVPTFEEFSNKYGPLLLKARTMK